MDKITPRPAARQSASKRRRVLAVLGAWLLIGVLGSVFVLSSTGSAVDLAGYDAALHLLPDPERGSDILIVGIDDPSVAAVGRWPWGRDIIADGLIDLRALGAEHVVLDITFPDASPTTVDRTELETDFSSLLESLADDLGALSRALESGQTGSRGAARALGQLQDETQALAAPEGFLSRALIDRDQYLGNAIGSVGTVVVAVTWDRSEVTGREYAPPEGSVLPRVTVSADAELPEVGAITGAVDPVEEQAATIGFVNARIDRDGVKRRADLFVRSGDQVIPTLGISPLMLDGYTDVTFASDRVRFSNGTQTLEAPLGPDGSLLLRWHRGQFEEGFDTLSFGSLITANELMEELVALLRRMQGAGYLAALPGGDSVFTAYEEAQLRRAQMTAGGDPQLMSQYVPRIETFLSDARRIFSEPFEQRLLDIVNEQPESDQLGPIRADIERTFGTGRALVERVTGLRRDLEELVAGRTVFVGFTAASTTDIGVTPFEEEYVNIGLHATVLRTIKTGDGLDRLPLQFGFIAFLVSMAILILALELLPPRSATVVGLTLVLIQLGAVAVTLVTARVYLPLAASAIMTFVSFSLLTALSYVMNERDKRQIRLAFEHYLAPAVINELLSDPSKLDVGGESRVLTAIFTDIEQFATAISRLEPAAVVELLGEYLNEMTRPILDGRGTIDKYEGDAIVAFFGAPLEDPNHARHACEAAIRMRRLEPVLNDRLVRTGLTQVPLRTRIGVHTGPMTVGNLGTEARLDYTVIGPEVNLASRLEHVNKQYGTYTIISEETFQAAGEGLLVRRMDRVRVVGIDRPVRLYELLGHADDSTAALREALDLFASGLGSFEQRDWKSALARFETVLKIYPTDGPAKLFAARCKRFRKHPVRESWDGVITLTEK